MNNNTDKGLRGNEKVGTIMLDKYLIKVILGKNI